MKELIHIGPQLEMKWRFIAAADRSKHPIPQLAMKWISIDLGPSGLKVEGSAYELP